MTSLEFWTEARLLMYPVLLVLGLMWSVLFWLQHRHGTIMTGFWTTLLGLAVAALGLAGFTSLVMAMGGYSSVTSGVLTLGLATIVLVLVAGVLAQGRLMWSGSGRGRE